MPATKVAPSFGPSPPDRGVKASTFRLLLDTAMELIREAGHVPSMADVAQRSGVSRATVYRYFPSRSALIAAVMDASLGPVRNFASPHSTQPLHAARPPSPLSALTAQLPPPCPRKKSPPLTQISRAFL